MTTTETTVDADATERRRFIPHPEAERFDRVTVDTVERWKESELSGDEWRFSHVATFWRHGEAVATTSGFTIEDALLRAAADFRSIKVEGPWNGDLSDVCAQPGCPERWVVLFHPVKRYTAQGEELVRPYNAEDVRGFCRKHASRGDCALDDADHNYEKVAERPEAELPWPRYGWQYRLAVPKGARLMPWSWLAAPPDDRTPIEQHSWAVWLGDGWTCGGCLAALPPEFAADPGPYPNLVAAPHDLTLVMAYNPDGFVTYRDQCPRFLERQASTEGDE